MAKQALQKLVRGPDGRMKVGWVDADTGVDLTYSDLISGGYEVVTASGEYYNPSGNTPAPAPATDDKGLNPLSSKQTEGNKTRSAEGGQAQRQDSAGYGYNKGNPRTAGSAKYVNKPGWAKYANLVPGPIGNIAKAVNVGINMNNTAAVNNARKSMGLPSLGFKDTVKSALKDQQGEVARVGIGEGQYTVGFEALDKYGRTNMTPDEANKRAAANKTSIKEIDNPRPASAPKSLVERVTGLEEGWAGKMLDDVFAGIPEPVAAQKVDAGLSPTAATQENTAKSLGVATPGSPVQSAHAIERERDFSAANAQSTAFAGSNVPKSAATASGMIGKPSGRPAMSVSENYGPQRPNAPTADDGTGSIVDAVGRSVQNALGPGYSVRAISGEEDEGHQYGSNRHQTGKAVDFDVVGPDGKTVTDKAALGAVSKDFGYNNPGAQLGFGDGYMAPGRMHMDTTDIGNISPTDNQNSTWGAPGMGIDPQVGAEFNQGVSMRQQNQPMNPEFAYEAPTSRPLSQMDVSLAAQNIATGLYPATAMVEAYMKVKDNPPAVTTVVAGRPQTPATTGLPAAAQNAVRPSSIGSLPAAPTQGVRPGVPGSLPAARAGTTVAGMPSTPASTGLPGARMGTTVAGRPNTPASTGLPAAQSDVSNLGISRNAYDTQKAPGNSLSSSLSPTEHKSVFSGIGPQDSYAKSVVSKSVAPSADRFAGVDLSTASPARMSSLGLVARTQEEKNAIAHTLAGELSPKSLKDLSSTDLVAREVARTELGNMVASIENRAATAKYGTIAGTLKPSQYNSLMTENLSVTNANYNQFNNTLNAAVGDFYTGALTPSDYNATNYYNPEISDPSWGTQMATVDDGLVGAHAFGSLPEYAPGKAFATERARLAAGQVADTRGWTPALGGVPSRTSTGGIGSDYAASRSAYNDSVGAGRGSSIGGPSISGGGGMSRSAGTTASGSGGLGSYGGGSAGKAATSGGGASRSSVSGASRSTAGKGGASPSAGSGGLSGASRSTAGKTSGSSSSGSKSIGAGGSAGASQRSGGLY